MLSFFEIHPKIKSSSLSSIINTSKMLNSPYSPRKWLEIKSMSLNRINSTNKKVLLCYLYSKLTRKINQRASVASIQPAKCLILLVLLENDWKNKSTSLNRINSTNKKVLLCYLYSKFSGKLNQRASVASVQPAKCLILLVLLKNDWKNNKSTSINRINSTNKKVLLCYLYS